MSKTSKKKESLISSDKTDDNTKRDFISIICNMSCNDINEFIMRHGKSPKKVLLYTLNKQPPKGD